MDIAMIMEFITTLGFPIACVVAMGFFIFYIYKQTTKTNAENMEKVQQRCAEREEKLYKEIALNREINGKAIETIALYAERLNHMEDDISTVKLDVAIIKDKVAN